jgi:peptide/nickel transport system permease protein
LLLAAIVGAIAVGVPTGIAYGWSDNRPLKAVAWSASTFAASLPAFFWAIALELLMVFIFFRFGLRFLPIAGFGIDEHLILPALALGLRPAAYIFRLTGTAVADIRHTDYVRAAIAKGLPDRQLLARHVLPNAGPNIIAATLLGSRGALSSLVIVEFVYIWDGAGLAFVQALGTNRLALASAIVLAFAVGSTLLVVGGEVARARLRVAP